MMLGTMGFEEADAARAALATQNEGVQQALDWLLAFGESEGPGGTASGAGQTQQPQQQQSSSKQKKKQGGKQQQQQQSQQAAAAPTDAGNVFSMLAPAEEETPSDYDNETDAAEAERKRQRKELKKQRQRAERKAKEAAADEQRKKDEAKEEARRAAKRRAAEEAEQRAARARAEAEADACVVHACLLACLPACSLACLRCIMLLCPFVTVSCMTSLIICRRAFVKRTQGTNRARESSEAERTFRDESRDRCSEGGRAGGRREAEAC